MRFAIATVALAGAVLAQEVSEEAQSTVYSTEYYTVTSCAAEVTNCPASSTVVESSVFPITTSTIYSTVVSTVIDCPETVTHCPADSTVVVTETVAVSTTVCPVVPTVPASSTGAHYGNSSVPVVHPPYPTSSHDGVNPSHVAPSSTFVTAAPECPTTSVRTISTSITTVIPTVIYETVKVACPTVPGGGNPGVPSPSGVVPSGGVPSGTKPPTPTFTAGAATMGGSVALAAAAGLLALFA
jgi:hypothetical protein